MTHFPDNPGFTGTLRPCRLQGDILDMEIEGEVLFKIKFENKYLCMMHDFGITEDYAVFNVMPCITSTERLEKRLPCFGFDHSLPTWCLVLPQPGSTTEGDGYIVCLVDDHVTNYSDLCFFDAQHVEEGPVAHAKLPAKLRQGLHGNWSTAQQLAAA